MGHFYYYVSWKTKPGNYGLAARGDISIYDGKTFTPLTHNKDDTEAYDVYSIIEDKKGNIWLGGWDGLRRYDGKTFTKFAHNKGYNYIIEDKKGNIWTFGSKGNSTRALSCYDRKSLYKKRPIVTVIMSGRIIMCFPGSWKLTMEVFGLDMMVDCIVMMERPSRTLKVKREIISQ